ncbi:transcription initiation factor iie beta subunit [Anaeramoeba ignava]|uniref:Transcription initiation factor iie beta subunit n=1 Tax=Anaeramoeba ignava TaxID=1746090 RepID=A0A9Q0RD58_ANAIG|nr:transcription initiation factor iie beta subunit [Anaeramoeba ignava]
MSDLKETRLNFYKRQTKAKTNRNQNTNQNTNQKKTRLIKTDATIFNSRNQNQKVSIESQIYKVVTFLGESERRPFSAGEIHSQTGVDIFEHGHSAKNELFQTLKKNPKIEIKDNMFLYKSKHQVHNKDDILNLVNHSENGLAFSDLEDAYPDILMDVKELGSQKKIILIQNDDNKKYTLFRINEEFELNIDPKFKSLWFDLSEKEQRTNEEIKSLGVSLIEVVPDFEENFGNQTKKPRRGRTTKRK